jgi:ribosomal protein L40E
VRITCGKCNARNDPGTIFCGSCGAYLEWSRAPADGADAANGDGTQRAADEGASSEGQAATAVHAPARVPEREYQPQAVQAEDEEPELPPIAGQLVCPNPKCGSGNWPDARFCRRCGSVLETSAVATPPSRLPWLFASLLVALWIVAVVVAAGGWLLYRPLGIFGAAVLLATSVGLGVLALRFKRAHRLEKDPLPAGERKRARDPFLGKDPMVLLRTGLKVLAIVLIVGVVLIGGLWAWTSAVHPQIMSFYASSREALFPRFKSVPPSRIWYVAPSRCAAGLSARPGGQRRPVTPTRRAVPNRFTPLRPRRNPGRRPCFPIHSEHSAAEAFDKDLNTFWLSPTPRGSNDLLVVRFQPQATIALFTIYAGDPTGEQVVPRTIQMTFYGPAETVYYPAPVSYPATGTQGPITGTRRRIYWPVAAVREWTLLNSQAQQRFSTGDLKNIARVVITIRGSYANPDASARQALTEVEFFDKY